MIFGHGLATFHVDSISKFAAGLKHRSQVRTQVTGQVNRKNIFLPRKLTIFNSKLTRYEKESVIMRGIVYFKLQDVALRY